MFSILGKEIIITNKSGHYGPPLDRLDVAQNLLLSAGYQDYVIKLEDYEKLDLGKLMTSYLATRRLAAQKSL